MKRISSKDNFAVKRLKQLEAKKYRDRLNMFVLEGPTVLQEALDENLEFEFAVFSDSFAEYEKDIELLKKLSDKKIEMYQVEDRLFSMMSGTETPQGVLAVLKKPEWDTGIISEPGNNFIVMDRVQDPGNMGTIIRTAEAAGFAGMVIIKGSTDPYSGKVSRAAAGALVRMPVFFADAPDELVNMMKNAGKKLVCTSPRSDKWHFETDIAEDTAIVIGNEASGVCDEIFLNADITAGIPMEGKTESLNAAIAASLMMYESLRQRKTKIKL